MTLPLERVGGSSSGNTGRYTHVAAGGPSAAGAGGGGSGRGGGGVRGGSRLLIPLLGGGHKGGSRGGVDEFAGEGGGVVSGDGGGGGGGWPAVAIGRPRVGTGGGSCGACGWGRICGVAGLFVTLMAAAVLFTPPLGGGDMAALRLDRPVGGGGGGAVIAASDAGLQGRAESGRRPVRPATGDPGGGGDGRRPSTSSAGGSLAKSAAPSATAVSATAAGDNGKAAPGDEGGGAAGDKGGTAADASVPDYGTPRPTNVSDPIASMDPTSPPSVRAAVRSVLASFFATPPPNTYATSAVEAAYEAATDTGVLVTIRSPRVSFHHTFPSSRHGRFPSLVAVLRRAVVEAAAAGAPLPNATFLVIVNDGSHPEAAAFGPARHWRSWTRLIPAPLGNSRGAGAGYGTEFSGWDAHVARDLVPSRDAYPWEGKIPRVLFRGNLAMQTHALGTCNIGRCSRARTWRDVARGVAWTAARDHDDLLDIGFTGASIGRSGLPNALAGAPPPVPPVPFLEQQAWRALLVVGSNQDWAERVRPLLHLGSVLLLHGAETVEWFTPLLRPWVHYVPVCLHFRDLVPASRWAVAAEGGGRAMVQRMNALAAGALTEAVMVDYWAEAVRLYADRQQRADAAEAAAREANRKWSTKVEGRR